MFSGDLFYMGLEWGEGKEEIEINAPFLFQEMEKELKEFLLEQQVEGDSTDGAFDPLDNLTNKIQKDFHEIIGEDTDKKSFIKLLMHLFALLLNPKVNNVNKIKRILKIAINTTLKIWSGRNGWPNVGPGQVVSHLG